MDRPASATTPPTRRRPIAWLGWGGLVAVLVILGWDRLHRRGNQSVGQSERTARELVQKDGRLCDPQSGGPFTGWLVERYPDAVLKSRSWLSNGVLQGLSEGWHTNGTLQIREQYEAGMAQGDVTRWREDGSKLSEGSTRGGKFEGTFRRWHPNGQLAEEVTFRAGTPDGLSRAWHPDGSLKAEVRHQNGTIVERHFWKPGEKDGRNLTAGTQTSS
jgi:antitoxin component YwqK of YwqJK toxin-antitoxin module